MDIQCSIPGIKPRKIKPLPLKKSKHDVLLLEENDAQKKIETIKEIPMILKSETLTKINVAPKVAYDVVINDQGLSGLSREQVMEIQGVIDRFLENMV